MSSRRPKLRSEYRTELLKLVLETIDEECGGDRETAELAKELFKLYHEKGLEAVKERIQQLVEEVLRRYAEAQEPRT